MVCWEARASVSASLSVDVEDVVVTVVTVREDTDVVMLVKARRELHLETSTQLCKFYCLHFFTIDQFTNSIIAVVVLDVDVVLLLRKALFLYQFLHCIGQEK